MLCHIVFIYYLDVDWKKINLEDFGHQGNYYQRQISRWSRQYKASETHNIEAMETLINWLPKNIPAGNGRKEI